MPNFTVDDADPTFAYSGGWAVQSDSDPDREEFFQETYHVATADGATASIQFLWGKPFAFSIHLAISIKDPFLCSTTPFC